MDTLFYAPIEDFEDNHWVELKGQEAQHISKVLRKQVGSEIRVANGRGEIYFCEITEINRHLVVAKCGTSTTKPEPSFKKTLAFGAIKKRDRLEFAIEKAVELGVWEICLFNSDHTERPKINRDRLHTLIVSAFKQSGRYWLPELVILDSMDEVLEHYKGAGWIMAHEKADSTSKAGKLTKKNNVLFVGPEGGFSEREVELIKKRKGEIVSLGVNRLRAETAVTALLSQYLF
ncbi:MAG: 16S rRNA (uracil(1498)-N(3))-methyltransferase [Balneola sp.]|nr:MAG: 16S rRNA (uracil(1498)-N(3))-methyltransferase [Balneola sp.]